MQNLIEEDPNLRDFFNYLYIEKGLSQNTVKSYKRDIDGFLNWSYKLKNTNFKILNEADINKCRDALDFHCSIHHHCMASSCAS